MRSQTARRTAFFTLSGPCCPRRLGLMKTRWETICESLYADRPTMGFISIRCIGGGHTFSARISCRGVENKYPLRGPCARPGDPHACQSSAGQWGIARPRIPLRKTDKARRSYPCRPPVMKNVVRAKCPIRAILSPARQPFSASRNRFRFHVRRLLIGTLIGRVTIRVRFADFLRVAARLHAEDSWPPLVAFGIRPENERKPGRIGHDAIRHRRAPAVQRRARHGSNS